MSISSSESNSDPTHLRQAGVREVHLRHNGHPAASAITGAFIRSARSANQMHGSRPLKVLFANKFFFLNGGSEAVMFDEMTALRRLGVEVIEISMQDPRNRPSDCASYFVSPKSYRGSSTLDRLKSALSFIHSREAVTSITRLFEAERPDILHCHNIYHQLTPSIITAAARLGVPVVLTLHDYKIVCPVYTQLRGGVPCTLCSGGRFEALLTRRCAGGSFGYSALLWAEARYHAAVGSYGRVDKFIAPSRFMRDAVVRRVGESKVIHIPNGIETGQITPAVSDEGYVLYAGRLAREKGVETLLRAHMEDRARWRLVVAGTGPLLDELQSRFPGAEFTGHLTGNDLQATIRKAALVVIPSEWHENSPMSVLEAMAHGKPVVASRIGGIPELVLHCETGLLFEPGDVASLRGHIATLLASPELRRQFGRKARRLAETHYTIEAHGAALLSLYERLTGRAGSHEQREA